MFSHLVNLGGRILRKGGGTTKLSLVSLKSEPIPKFLDNLTWPYNFPQSCVCRLFYNLTITTKAEREEKNPNHDTPREVSKGRHSDTY